jgi:streptogramin lyase
MSSQGAGPGFGLPTDIAVERNGNLVVTDSGGNAVLRVDPASGNRSIVADRDTGVGSGFAQAMGITVGNNNVILVADRGVDAVFQVDPITGNRTVVSGCPASGDPCPVPIVGAGEAFINLEDIAILTDTSLVVVDADRDAVIQVAPITGDRTILSDAAVGSGPVLTNPIGIVTDALGAVYVLDTSLDAIVRVDVGTGNRTIVSGCSQASDPCPGPLVGLGPDLQDPEGIAVENNGFLVITDVGLGAILRVDVVTGDRTIVSDVATGSGPLFFTPVAIAVEPSGALVVVDGSRKALFRVDALTGARTILSKQSELTISPPSGLYANGQSFDLALIIEGVGNIVASSLVAVLDDNDVTASLLPCLTQASLGGGGAVLQCPAASMLLGLTPGRHVLSITYPLGPDPAVNDALKNSVTWEIVSTQ